MEDINKILDNCDLDNCSIPKDENGGEEEVQTFVEELQKTLLAPSISGIYITRLDIKKIASEYGESLSIGERKKMLQQLFKYIDSADNMENMFNLIDYLIKQKIDIYNELADMFPASKEIFTKNTEKANNILNRLETLVQEAKEEVL